MQIWVHLGAKGGGVSSLVSMLGWRMQVCMSPGGATAAGTRAAVLQDPFAVSSSKPVVKISSMPLT